MARSWTGWAAGLALSGLVACWRGEKSPVARGEGVFLRSCASCHGANARGLALPGLAVRPRDLTDPALQARLTDDLLRDTIRYGKGQMPPFGAALPEADVRDLVLYLRSLGRKSPAPK